MSTAIDCTSQNALKEAQAFYNNKGEWAGQFRIFPEVIVQRGDTSCDMLYSFEQISDASVTGKDWRTFDYSFDSASNAFRATRMGGYQSGVLALNAYDKQHAEGSDNYVNLTDGSVAFGQPCHSSLNCAAGLFCYKNKCAVEDVDKQTAQFCSLYLKDSSTDPEGASCQASSLEDIKREEKCYLVNMDWSEEEGLTKNTTEVPCSEVPDSMYDDVPLYLQVEEGGIERVSDADRAAVTSASATYYCQNTRERNCFDETYVCPKDFRVYATRRKCDDNCDAICDTSFERESYIRVVHTTTNLPTSERYNVPLSPAL